MKRFIFFCFILLLFACFVMPSHVLASEPATIDPDSVFYQIGQDKPVRIICVHLEGADPHRHTPQEWADMLNEGINEHYEQITYGQTTWDFTAEPDWVDYPGGYDGWNDDTRYDRLKNVLELAGFDAEKAEQYPYVVLILNKEGRGYGSLGPWLIDDKPPYQVAMAVVCEYDKVTQQDCYGTATGKEACSVIAHELGHTLGCIDLYGSRVQWENGYIQGDYVGKWGLMAEDWSYPHFIGWTKVNREWLTGDSIQTVDAPTAPGQLVSEDILVQPLEWDKPGAQIVKVPITAGDPYYGYFVELRLKENGDENIPDEGFLVTLVDESEGIKKVVVMVRDTLTNATYTQGQEFEDELHRIRITPQGSVAVEAGETPGSEGWYLLVERWAGEEPENNPRITPWSPPPYESPDIWIDAPHNGWDVYEKHILGDSSVPVHNGDRPEVGVKNRVWVRVHNDGPYPAVNVRVKVSYTDPPVISGTKEFPWKKIGECLIPVIPAAGYAEGYVAWKPKEVNDYGGEGGHVCLLAELIGGLEFEVDKDGDNQAQENISDYYTSPMSPTLAPVDVTVQVGNHYGDSREALINIQDLPDGWEVEFPEGRSFILDTEEIVTKTVRFILPPGLAMGSYFEPTIVALLEDRCHLYPVGGLTCGIHVTPPTSVQVTVPNVVAVGEPFTLQGNIAPGGLGLPIVATFKSPSGQTFTARANTLAQGEFVIEQGLEEPGDWEVKVRSPGASDRRPGESSVFHVSVASGEKSQGAKHPRWDINEDGKIDLRDLAMLGRYFGEPVAPAYSKCDVNEDGTVDNSDLMILKGRYGEGRVGESNPQPSP